MVGVAQLAEHQVVALGVVGSSPITHPILPQTGAVHIQPAPVSFAPVAQLDRAPDFESVGRGFESLRARQLFQVVTLFTPPSHLSLCENPCETFPSRIIRLPF